MSEKIRIRGELPFPSAGEGVVLRFTNPDCDAIQKKFGDNWFVDAIARTNRFDLEYLEFCFEVGAKKDGKKAGIKFSGLDCPMVEIAESVLDALFLAMQGRTFNDHLEYLDSMRHAKEDEGNE